MGFPFEKDNKRRWSCFVCGVAHNDFESFQAHIIEKHEEGRDYIRCPLERCRCCVREIRSHFAAKHAKEPIPKVGQMRAIIWKDVSTSGKCKTKKPRFHEGHLISMKNHGKEIKYRSRMECDFFECLEAIPEVLAYDYEPFKTGIPYLFDGSPHHYFPDLSVKFVDGHVEIWEIKPESQTDLPVNKAKWIAATHYCEARGWDFIVMTEITLDKLKRRVRDLKNSQTMLS